MNYIEQLKQIVRNHPYLPTVMRYVRELQVPNGYIGAGSITQAVWNTLAGRDVTEHIKDVDLVYFDSDTSYERENQLIEQMQSRCTALPIPLDMKNQARVHLWYEKHFGYAIPPYPSVEAAIATWPTTASAIAVRWDDHSFDVIAPFGLDDLFQQIIRPNKAQITEGIYLAKVQRWTSCWPNLTVIPW